MPAAFLPDRVRAGWCMQRIKMSEDVKREEQETIVILKENAVFWMDGQGRWRNRHGIFTHKGIIDHFNGSIHKDAGGYFVSQTRDGVLEKVYFRFEETALFAVDVVLKKHAVLVLNTGARAEMAPDRLFIFKDHLFQHEKDHIVKFSERALVKMSAHITVKGDDYAIACNGVLYSIPVYATLPVL
jgi:hypothetical protein